MTMRKNAHLGSVPRRFDIVLLKFLQRSLGGCGFGVRLATDSPMTEISICLLADKQAECFFIFVRATHQIRGGNRTHLHDLLEFVLSG